MQRPARIQEISGRTLRDLEKLNLEIEAVHQRVVLVEWGSGHPLHGMGRTAYGYVMCSMAFVDLLSRYRTDKFQPQTPRMVKFLVAYLGYDDLASRVVVQTWRHGLMHTGSPGEVKGRTRGQRYKYLLQWGEEHLPREQHMRFQSGATDPHVLALGVTFLAADVRSAAAHYFDDVGRTEGMAQTLVSAHSKIARPALFDD